MIQTENFALLYSQHKHYQTFVSRLQNNKTSRILLKGLQGSARSLYFLPYYLQHAGIHLVILTDREEAGYFCTDLNNLLGEGACLFFPSSYQRSMLYGKTESTSLILRTEVLNRLSSENQKLIIVSYPEALSEKVVTKENLQLNTLTLHVGEKISMNFLVEVLTEYEFERVDFVYEPGQFSIRGSIVDIFSFAGEYPYRVDFFGDEVDSIRTFEVASQLSRAKWQEISIVPNIQNRKLQETRESFFHFVPQNTTVWIHDAQFVLDRMNQLFDSMVEKGVDNDYQFDEQPLTAEDLLISGLTAGKAFLEYNLVELANKSTFKSDTTLTFNTIPQPDFPVTGDMELLIENLKQHELDGYQNFIISENDKQIERLRAIFDKDLQNSRDGIGANFSAISKTIHEGFIDNDLRIVCYTDHQIFHRHQKFAVHRVTDTLAAGKEAVTLRELNGLQPGDFVVHVDHGVGKFAGLQRVEINGKFQEVIQLIFEGNDILYVNIHSLHRISKYKSKEGEPPKVHKLGSGVWQKLKQKTKSRMKDIAKDLIALYAKRRAMKGHAFAEDSYMQSALESSFIYEDTPDQIKATEDVKRDMELDVPMDRLVCGDVGFGKTEIAIRAAFKAAVDGKQTAVLVPTTILALQHFNTFKERLKEFPCTVDYISRMKSTKDQNDTLKKLKDGKIDILIGTHRIVGKDVVFKDLGLLVIDEEQKFGVTVKEKLRQMKLNVDTLTLTATPIPRTMQFSLLGARDLSILNTPPPNRYPIDTEVHTFNETIIREAIEYEVARNGQVFFINNRIQNIAEIQSLIGRLCPGVRTIFAHGQMEGAKLEKIMFDFVNHRYDVLIATSIIENGLDISNANTVIVNEAQNFGLSDLHQLRGRVGRSNKKAFCYLMAPPLTFVTQDARRRLRAIEDFAELGSGFNIALQDLDIRGAGDLLGAEQSGFISDIGYETYQRILNEALLELRENEFKDFYKKVEEEDSEKQKFKTPKAAPPSIKQYVIDCQIDTDLELLFADDYVTNVSERIKLYRELDNIESEERLKAFEIELVDRFGNLPQPSRELLNVVRLRWLAMSLGMEKIILKNNKMLCYFVSNQESPFYQSPVFQQVLNYVQKHVNGCQMREQKNKLTLAFDKIEKVNDAINVLKAV